VTRTIHLAHGLDNTFDLRAEFLAPASGKADAKQITGATKTAAGTPSATKPDMEDKEVVETKVTHRPAALAVNFRKELDLPFATLGTLGSRIDAARRQLDPVALSHAASELAVAEKVSGKKASMTSTQVLQEAAELAKLRKQESELKAVLQASNQVMYAEDDVATLRSEIAAAQAQAKAQQLAFQQNQEPTSAPRQVVINNYTPQYIAITVNGYYQTQVLPGSSQVITIDQRYNPVVLNAAGNEEIDTWGPRYIWGKFTKYTWNLN
jgi:hypothetical protein